MRRLRGHDNRVGILDTDRALTGVQEILRRAALALRRVLQLLALALHLLASSLQVNLALALNGLVELVVLDLICGHAVTLGGLRIVLVQQIDLLLVQ